MKRSFWLFLLIGITQLATAQYTEIINSNRPGFSRSPFGIGSNVYQVEGGFFYRKIQIKKRFSNPRSFGKNLSFRYSYFDEKLEFNLDITQQTDRLAFRNIFTSRRTIKGLSQFTIGAKYLLFKSEYTNKFKEIRSWKKRTQFDKKRLIPSVGVYLGVNTPLVDNYYGSSLSPKIAVYLQNDLTNRYVILTNFIADKLGTDEASYTYIITETYTLNDKYSIFLENLGRYNVNFGNEQQFAAGVAYLKSKNLQLDASLRLLIEGKAYGTFFGFGASWRMDRHKEKAKLNASKTAVDKILEDKNRDKSAVAKKKGALQQLYKKSKRTARNPKKLKQSKKIKSSKRQIRKLPKRRIKKLPKKRVKTEKKDKVKKKSIFSKLFKKKKKKEGDKKDETDS